MARDIQLPCNGEGVCMRCKSKVPSEETLTCGTCVTPWHAACLSSPPATLVSTIQWTCPDCSGDVDPVPVSAVAEIGGESELITSIRAIEADQSLTEKQKARKKQTLMSGQHAGGDDEDENKGKSKDVAMSALGGGFKCSFCQLLPERPVTVCSFLGFRLIQ